MLVEAAGRLFGTLDLDAVLPDVLALAQSTLEADAYSLWRHDPDLDAWSMQASRRALGRLRRRGAGRDRGQREHASRSTRRSSSHDIASAEWLTRSTRPRTRRRGRAR